MRYYESEQFCITPNSRVLRLLIDKTDKLCCSIAINLNDQISSWKTLTYPDNNGIKFWTKTGIAVHELVNGNEGGLQIASIIATQRLKLRLET